MYNEETWQMGEQMAQEYMKKHGYKIIYTNLKEKSFELDIVAILPKKTQAKTLKAELKTKLKVTTTKEEKMLLKQNFNNLRDNLKDMLIITEVKARTDDRFGRDCECIDLKKRNHLMRGAKFLTQKPELSNMQVRFDVASVDAGKVTYIENSFCG